jgi:FlaA1/EpsC-like NDP-sugar epimerase
LSEARKLDETKMVGEMDTGMVVGYFRGKNILITGSTGFLGKGMCSVFQDVHCVLGF